MTAQFIGARVPICDTNTGIANPIWYRLWQQLFDISGTGSVPDSHASSVAPAFDQDLLYSLVASAGEDVSPVAATVAPTTDDLAPVAPIYLTILDDVSPAYAVLEAQLADLRAQIDDLRKGLSA